MSMTLSQLASIFARAASHLPTAEHEILEKSSVMLEDSAKSAIGTYRFGWTPLAEAMVRTH